MGVRRAELRGVRLGRHRGSGLVCPHLRMYGADAAANIGRLHGDLRLDGRDNGAIVVFPDGVTRFRQRHRLSKHSVRAESCWDGVLRLSQSLNIFKSGQEFDS